MMTSYNKPKNMPLSWSHWLKPPQGLFWKALN